MQETELAHLRQRMLSVARRYVGDVDDAEDAVHDALLRLMERSGMTADEVEPIAIVAVRNRAIDIRRTRHSHSDIVHEQLQDSGPTPEQSTLANERQKLIATIIAQMPPMQQAVMTLCHNDGLTNSDIAALTGLNDAAVRQHLSRDRRKIFEELLKQEQA